jgi:hypothetical protein
MHDEEQTLTTDQLLSLFKHWDSRVESFEKVFFPLSFAILPAVIASGSEQICIYIVGAIVSMAFYCLHMLVIDKIACYQDEIFETLIKRGYSDLQKILMHNPMRLWGVRKIRKFGIILLLILWLVLIFYQFF